MHYPRNMAPWDIDSFRLKEARKQNSRTVVLIPAPTPFPLEVDHKTVRRDAPSPYPQERSILISEDKGTPRRILTIRICYVFPSLSHLPSFSFTYHILPRLSTFHQTKHKNTQV